MFGRTKKNTKKEQNELQKAESLLAAFEGKLTREEAAKVTGGQSQMGAPL